MDSAVEAAAVEVAARKPVREPAAPKSSGTALRLSETPCRASNRLRSPSLAKTAVTSPSTPFPKAGAPARNIKLHSIAGFGRSSATASIVPSLNLQAIGGPCCSAATGRNGSLSPSDDFPEPCQKLAKAQISCCNPFTIGIRPIDCAFRD